MPIHILDRSAASSYIDDGFRVVAGMVQWVDQVFLIDTY
jgi:hypothetical protein